MSMPAVRIPPAAQDRAWDMIESLALSRPESMTVSWLARKVGVTGQSLANWEDGEYMPGLAAFIAWADALGFDVELIDREGSR